MPRRTQRDWTDIAVRVLARYAKDAKCLPEDATLVFEPGDPKASQEPAIVAYNENGKLEPQPPWLPKFNPKETARMVERVADAQANVFYWMHK